MTASFVNSRINRRFSVSAVRNWLLWEHKPNNGYSVGSNGCCRCGNPTVHVG